MHKKVLHYSIIAQNCNNLILQLAFADWYRSNVFCHLYAESAYLYPLKSQNEVKQLEQPVYLALRACIYIIL